LEYQWRNYLLSPATDDILVCSKTRTLYHLLKQSLEKLFDLTCAEGSTIKFLNLRIVQSPARISFDQTEHKRLTFLEEYFRGVPPKSIPYQPFPFPIAPSFDKIFYESVPLVGIPLTTAVKCFGISFGHIVGVLMHINGISRPGLAYCYMHFAGYMACPNLVIFETLHLTMCYLYHHQHLLIMYSFQKSKLSGDTLKSF
jgi:hypothetical protein